MTQLARPPVATSASSSAVLAMAALASAMGCKRGLSTAALDRRLPALATWGGLSVRTAGERSHPVEVVILLHGWGAPGDDLVPLAAELAAPGRLFVFPEAPLSSQWGGRAWWHLDLVALDAARARGQDRDLRETTPDGMVEARRSVLLLLDELERKTGLPRSAFVLGGFSQGAMLAFDVALASETPPAAIVVLSGTLVAEDRWTVGLAALRQHPIPIFISHGRTDAVLPFRLALALRDMVTAAGIPATWVPFEGGHGIPADVLAALAKFLERR